MNEGLGIGEIVLPALCFAATDCPPAVQRATGLSNNCSLVFRPARPPEIDYDPIICPPQLMRHRGVRKQRGE